MCDADITMHMIMSQLCHIHDMCHYVDGSETFEKLSRWHPQLSGASFFGSDFIGDVLRELDRDLGVDVPSGKKGNCFEEVIDLTCST